MPISGVKISPERQDARSFYFAEWLAIGDHSSLSVSSANDWLKKPDGATHLMMQPIDANIRYTIDESDASSTHGFQLAQGAISPISCPMRGISVARETDETTIQYQWIR